MASFEERLAQMRTPAGGAAPAVTEQDNSVQDRLAQMRGTQGGAATPSPTPAVSTAKDEDEDKGNFWDRVKGMFGNIFTKEEDTEQQPTTLQTANKAESRDDEDVTNYLADINRRADTAVERNANAEQARTNLGYVGERGVASVPLAVQDLINMAGYMGQAYMNVQNAAQGNDMLALGAVTGNDTLMSAGEEKVREATEPELKLDTVAHFGDKANAKVEEKYAGKISENAAIAGDIASTIGYMVPSIISNIIAPGSSLFSMALSAGGGATQEAIDAGIDHNRALLKGTAVGITAALSEKIADGLAGIFGKGAADDFIESLVKSKLSSEGAQTAVMGLYRLLGEGFEEFAEELANKISNELIIDAGTSYNYDERSFGETLKDAGISGLMGIAVSGIINTANGAARGLFDGATPKQIADAAADTVINEVKGNAAQGEISPSEGVSAEPTTYTANAENVSRVDPGAPGFETANVDGEQRAESADYYGKSTGAATPNIGPMVETQNKAITENVNLGEESIAANQPAPHEQISEALSLARAGAMLYTDSEGNVVNFDETLDDLMSKEGNWTGVESDAVQLLLKEAERRGDAEAVKRIAERMAKEGTDLGQALQSRQKWISAEPASRLAAMYQTVAKFAEKHKAIKGGKIEIPDFLAKAYLEADSEVKRDEIIGDIQEYVAQQSRSSLMEKWTALRYTNMLGNFKTQIRNLAGNTTMLLTTRAKDMVGALAEAIYGKGRTKSAFVGKEWMRAAKSDYVNAKKQIMSYGKYTDENFKGDFAEGIEDKRKILPAGLEQYRKATSWAMETGDTIFSKAVYSRALAGFLKANGVAPEQLTAGTVDSGLMEKARAYAVKQAQEATFRDSNAFSDWASTFLRTEDTPEAIKVLGEGLMPFRRTPANVLARAVEYSPLGVVNTAVKAAKAHKGDGDVTASDVIDSLAKTITGTGLAVLGYLLSDMGLLRASGDEEDEGIDALMGRQDWSLVIPGVGSYTFDWAAPTSLIMFTGAALHEMTSDEGLTFSDLEGALTSLTEPLIQMSMLSGINDTLDSIKYSDNNLLQMAGQLAAGYLTQGLTNTLLGQIERTGEDVRMSTYTEADSPLPEWLQRTIGKASAKTPGWDYQQAEYLNEFGETEDSGSVAQRLIENLLSPGYWEPTKEGEPVYDFAQDAYDSLSINAFPDAYAPKSISYDGTTHVLTQEQREAYQRTQGQTAKKLMEAAERSSAYDALGDDAKRDVISELLSFAHEQGKRDALDISGDMSDKEKAVAALSPNDMVKYFSLKSAASAMDKDGATNEEISAMQSLIDSPISKSVAEIIMDGDFKKMYDADKAGISVRQFSTISANMDTLKTPAGYTNKPNWQKYGVIAGSNLDDGKKLELIGIYGGESAYNNFSEALGNGYSFDRVVDFYEAYTRKNADGTSKDAADKKAAVLAAGFTETQYLALKKIFS